MESDSPQTRWLDALSDGTAGLQTISPCMSVCDLKCDNYFKLVAAEIPFSLDSKPRLRVYKGTQVIHEQMIPGIPSSVQSLYIEETQPKMPIIAVSVGPSILFYRNMKPYFKFTVPSLMIEALETEVWKKLPSDRPINYKKHIDELKSMNISKLSSLSQKLISLPADEVEGFLKENSEPKLERLPTVVAMTTIFKGIEEDKAPNCLIVATEAGDILTMDAQSFNILHTARVCNANSTPDLISASGSYMNEFKIVIATREGSLCILRKNWLEGREIVKLRSPAIAMSLLQIDQTIVVLTHSLMCYSQKGKLLWDMKMTGAVLCMTPVSLPHLGVSLVCVGLKGGLVQLYSQKVLIDQFQAPDSVMAMTFGRLGQEEHVLVLMTFNGSLLIKILKRTAEFKTPLETKDKTKLEPSNMTLAIPKKTKIFIEQMSELWRMRLEAAKTTVEILRTGDSTFSGDHQTPLKLLAQVDGLGPDFLLLVTLENISATKMASHLAVLLHADPNHYKIDKRYVELTPLLPGIPLIMDFQVTVRMTSENMLPDDLSLENSIIRVLIMKDGFAKPLIASTVVMPQPEMQFLL